MRIELRKVRCSPSLSEETNAFTADVWIDGRKAGSARNQGTGGPTDVYPATMRDSIDEYARTLPEVEVAGSDGAEPTLLKLDAGWVIDRLLADWFDVRDMHKKLKNRLLYIKDNEPGIMMTKPMTPQLMTEVIGSAHYKAAWKVNTWLNSLPEDEALALYRKHA